MAAVTAVVLSLTVGAIAPHTAFAQTATPADTLVGQQVTTCNEGVQFTIAVTKTQLAKVLNGQVADGNGMWLVLSYNATDISSGGGAVAGTLKLQDDQGRAFSPDNPGSPLVEALSQAYGFGGSYSPLRPGITMPQFEPFQVAQDARTFILQPEPFECS
jgi:hypothetical protein